MVDGVVVERLQYNPGFSWSDTGLRSSLDSDFYINTFTEEEKSIFPIDNNVFYDS